MVGTADPHGQPIMCCSTEVFRDEFTDSNKIIRYTPKLLFRSNVLRGSHNGPPWWAWHDADAIACVTFPILDGP